MSEFDKDKPFAEEGYALMAAAFEVHNIQGGGLSEEIYQESLEIELELREIPCLSKAELRVFYKDRRLKKTYIPDLLVYDKIVVELKSVSALASEHEAQLFNYLRITRHPVGYLINFAPLSKIEWKRFVLSEFLQTES
jgi:GxxExxY protein